ncbi:MAG: porin [Pseudomonadota bacterium]
MKKILIASAALVATTTVASAQEINFSGLARFGIGYDEDRADESIIISRFRLNIDASTELDSGLRLAARLRGEANENSDGTSGTFEFGAPRFQADLGGFRLRVGNISGVIDAAEVIDTFGNDLGLEGTLGQIDTFNAPIAAFDSDGSGSSQGVSLLYTVGDLSLAASYVEDLGANGVSNDLESFEVGVGYGFGNYSVGAAFGSTDTGPTTDVDFWLLSLTGDIGAFGFSVVVGDNELNGALGGDDTSYGLTLDYDISDATNIAFTYAGGGTADIAGNDDSYGIGVDHDLGAGATLRGFIGQDVSGSTRADLGVRFDF